MTTTTKKDAKGKESAPIEAGWEDAAQVSSESDHPAWCPQWSIFKEDAIADKLQTVPEGSHCNKVLIGSLVIANAFAEDRYFVDVKEGDKTTRMALPLHGALTATLDRIDLSAKPMVRLAFKGEAGRSREGERAAFLYDVRVKPGAAMLKEPRADALLPVHRANKEKRDAAKKAARRSRDGADDATDE